MDKSNNTNSDNWIRQKIIQRRAELGEPTVYSIWIRIGKNKIGLASLYGFFDGTRNPSIDTLALILEALDLTISPDNSK